MAKSNQGAGKPSTTGNPSGGGRDNNPPRPKPAAPQPAPKPKGR